MRDLIRSVGIAALAGALLVGGCSDSDDPTAPTVERVTGNYRATRLAATVPLGGRRDLLREGGSLTMEFAASGALAGQLVIPSEGVNEDFTGTWRISGGEVEIEQATADTFVEDLRFTLVRNTLVADRIIDLVRIQATLTKQ